MWSAMTKPSLNEIKGEVLLDDTEKNVLEMLLFVSFFLSIMAAGPLRNLFYPDFTLCFSLVSSTTFSALSRSLLCLHISWPWFSILSEAVPISQRGILTPSHPRKDKLSISFLSAPANLCVCSEHPSTASSEACCSFVSFQKDGKCIAKLDWLMIFLLHKEREGEEGGNAVPMSSVRRRGRGKTLKGSQWLESFSKMCWRQDEEWCSRVTHHGQDSQGWKITHYR